MNVASFAIALPWPPRALWPNGRPHFMAKARAVKAMRWQSRFLAGIALKPIEERPAAWTIQIVAYPPPRSRPDDDGILGAMKAARDGIADALGTDDHQFRMASPPVVFGERVKGGAIKIIMEALQ